MKAVLSLTALQLLASSVMGLPLQDSALAKTVKRQNTSSWNPPSELVTPLNEVILPIADLGPSLTTHDIHRYGNTKCQPTATLSDSATTDTTRSSTARAKSTIACGGTPPSL